MKWIMTLSVMLLAAASGCRHPCNPCAPRCDPCATGAIAPPTTYIPPSSTPAPIYVPQTTPGR